MKYLIVDTLALIIFSTVAGIFVEFFIVKLNFEQIVQTRFSAIPLILLTARPYGLYRDWLFRQLGEASSNQIKATLLDIFAFVTFQAPVYAIILILAGADARQIVTAVISATVILVVSGRPYGLFLVYCRKLAGLHS